MTSRKEIIRYGVAETGIVPIRSAPSETSEMVNQLLLGETVGIIAQEGVWTHILTDYDGYEGWVSSSQIRGLSETDYHQWVTSPDRSRFRYQSIIAARSPNHYLQIPAGSCVPADEKGIDWFGETYYFQSEPIKIVSDGILDTAMGFLGVSYLWGGRTDTGIDCSGFIQTIHMLHDIQIPRDSTDQFEFGEQKGSNLHEAVSGDIIYFKYRDRPVTHIGFYLGEGLLLHASAQVKIDQIDPDRQTEKQFTYNQSLAEGIVGIIRPYSVASP